MRILIALALAALFIAPAVAEPRPRSASSISPFPTRRARRSRSASGIRPISRRKAETIETAQQIVARDGAVKGDHLPLVVISHGHGGSYAGHFDTAIALAQAGFVAAALTHNGDSWRDPSNPTAIWERPRQLKALTDYMLERLARPCAHRRRAHRRLRIFGGRLHRSRRRRG